MRWEIRRLEKRGDEIAAGAVVASLETSARGDGSLQVVDESWRDLLEDLFLNDQTAFEAREAVEGGTAERTTVRVLEAWQPETLAHLRGKLGRYGLVAQDCPLPP